jgi:hypothetical protein
MPTIDEFIRDSKYAHELFHKVRDHIFQTKCGHLEPYESYVVRLTEGERFCILVAVFIWEDTNGGLSQFLTNSSGDYFENTNLAMRTIGATIASAALDKIRAVIFNNTPVPSNRSDRCDIIFDWEEKDEAAARALFEPLDRELGWCESVEYAMAKYITTHKEMFPVSPG